MARYIDADKLKSLFLKNYCVLTDIIREQNDYGAIIGISALIGNTIANAPTADVQEVKHGKWELSVEPLGMQDVDCVKCSLCGELFIVDEDYDFDYIKELFKYCPNCGAKMDGKD